MKYVELTELLDSGILQEANRKFFHPIGMALGVHSELGKLDRIVLLDCREDPEGIVFTEIDMDKFRKFTEMCEPAHSERMSRFGFVIQPVETKFPVEDGERFKA